MSFATYLHASEVTARLLHALECGEWLSEISATPIFTVATRQMSRNSLD